MTKTERKIILDALYNYREYKTKTVDVTDIAESHLTPEFGKVGSGKGTPKNGKENAVIKVIDEDIKRSRLCLAIEKTLERYEFDEPKKNFMFLRFIGDVHGRRYGIARVSDKIGISERTANYWIEEIINYVYMWAVTLKAL